MTALQELVKFIEGDIRKGYVDHFLFLERKQIIKAFEAGKTLASSGKEYYEITYGPDGQKDPLPPEFWTKGE